MTQLTKSLSSPNFFSQVRAFGAIVVKDWRHHWRYPLNVLGDIFQPIIWLTPMVFMGRAFSVNGEAAGFAGYSGSSDYISFILIGTVLTNLVMSVFWGMGFSLKGDMDTGVLEANWLCPISHPLMLVARTITSLALTLITSLLTLACAAMLFGFSPTGNALSAVVTAIPMLLGLYGFGMAFAALVMLLREANALVDISSFIVQVISGTNFPVQALPRWLLPFSLALPLTYGFDAIRGLLLKTRTILPIPIEISILIAFMVVFVAGGLMIFNRVERSVRRKGTLGQH